MGILIGAGAGLASAYAIPAIAPSVTGYKKGALLLAAGLGGGALLSMWSPMAGAAVAAMVGGAGAVQIVVQAMNTQPVAAALPAGSASTTPGLPTTGPVPAAQTTTGAVQLGNTWQLGMDGTWQLGAVQLGNTWQLGMGAVQLGAVELQMQDAMTSYY